MSKRAQQLGLSAVILLFLCSGCKAFSIYQELSPVKMRALKEIGEYYKKSANISVDPCAAYNDYICGKFDVFRIRLNDEFSENQELDENDKRKILKKYLPNRKYMSAAEVKMQDFLTSCKNKDKDHPNLKELARFNYSELIGEWPAFNSQWNSSKFDLVSAIVEFPFSESFGISFSFQKVNGIFTPSLAPEEMPIADDEEEKERDLLELFGVPNVDQVMSDIQLFKKEYRNATSVDTSEKAEDMTYAVLKNRFPQFDWDKFFEIGYGKSFEDITIKPIHVYNLDEIKAVYNTVAAMEPRVVANYLFVRFLDLLKSEFKKDRNCYDLLFDHFEPVISTLVVSNLYNWQLKDYFMDMVRAVVETLFDDKEDHGRKNADDIMTEIENFFENEFLPSLTEEKVIENYEDMQIDPTKYYENLLQIWRYHLRKGPQSHLQFSEFDIGARKRRALSKGFIKMIYNYHRKPSPIIYNFIVIQILKFVKTLPFTLTSRGPPNDSSESVTECFQRYDDDLIKIKFFQIHAKAFDKWAEKYHEVVEKEDEFLSQFNLTGKKLLFALLTERVCTRYNRWGWPLLEAAFRNEEDFAREFNCPRDSPMNPEIKCPRIYV